MEYLDFEPSADELATCEAELEDWERLAVRDYWAAVIAEELGAPEPQARPSVWRSMGPGERERLRRTARRAANTTLRLVADNVAVEQGSAAPNFGEAA